MQLGDPRSAEVAASIVGQMIKKFRSESSGVSVGEGNKNLDWTVFHNISQSESKSVSTQERYDYIVRPEEFARLDIGEAFTIPLAAKQCFKIKVPIYEPAFREAFDITHYSTPAKVGLNLGERFNVEFSESEMELA
jgi:hypothetical protein